MKQEAATLKAIQNWLEIEGYLYVRVNPPGSYAKKLPRPKRVWTKKGMKEISWEYGFKKIRASQKGAPDLIVFFAGTVACFEVKSQEGKQRPEQKAWAERAAENNIRYFVVRNFDEFILLMSPAWRRPQ